MEMAIIIGYVVSISVISLFAIIQLYLISQYKNIKAVKFKSKSLDKFPVVTVQLPVYNEKYVVKRLVEAVCNLSYPSQKLEIQVLDDSDDETQKIVSDLVKEWTHKRIDIKHIRRGTRTGYKAGALQAGLLTAKGEFIAIFDADFIPETNFLQNTLPHFEASTGMVQTRWGHLNKEYNLLTRAQAFGLDAHFTIEQSGRQQSGRLINFNGTAGVWRKSCIHEAGGWQSDTLTEDLDLSYRAQLKGWKFSYLEDITSPGELPTVLPSIKSQQYRWNKGAAETARKCIPDLLKSKLSLGTKIHGIAHLLNSSVFLWLFIAALTSVPLLIVKHAMPDFWLWSWSIIFIFGFMVIALFYWTAARGINPKSTLLSFLRDFPTFIALTSGLSLHNSIAVSEGYLGIKSPFIRTPKLNILSKSDGIKNQEYLRFPFSPIILFEGLLSLYFLSGMALGIYLQEFGFLLWHLILAVGFGFVFYRSLIPYHK